jgi:hypothetical protein
MSIWNAIGGNAAAAAPWMRLLQQRGAGNPPYSTPGIGDDINRRRMGDGMPTVAPPMEGLPGAPAAAPDDRMFGGLVDPAPIKSMSPTLEETMPTDASALAGMAAPKMKGGGVFDRIGDFIGSDDGKAALFRAGAEMLSSGDIGRGMSAGAGWMDQQRIQRAREAQWQKEHALKEQGVNIDQQRADQSGLYQAAQIDDMAMDREIEVAKLQEAIRKAQAGEQLDTMEMLLLNRYREGQLNLGWAQNATSERNSVRDYSASVYGTDSANMRHGTVSADNRYSTDATNWRHVNPATPPMMTTWTQKDPDTGTTMSGKYPRPPAAAINRARANPAERDMFESTFGPGSWAMYIGG